MTPIETIQGQANLQSTYIALWGEFDMIFETIMMKPAPDNV